MEKINNNTQSTSKDEDSRGDNPSGDSGIANKSENVPVQADDSFTPKGKGDGSEDHNGVADKKALEYKKFENHMKKKYLLRISKDDASEDDNSMETDVTNEILVNADTDGDISQSTVDTRCKRTKIVKKRKKSVASSKNDSSEDDNSMETDVTNEILVNADTDGDISQSTVNKRCKRAKNVEKRKKSVASSKNELTTLLKKNESDEAPPNTENVADVETETYSTSESDSSDDSSSDYSISSISSLIISRCDTDIGSLSSYSCSEQSDYDKCDDEEWLSKHVDPIQPHTWSTVKELHKRQYGCHHLFWQEKVRRSRSLTSRLEQQYTLDGHEGCVNALHFNQKGTLLASAGDDLDIKIWDFQSSDRKPYISYNSGHRSNVFQSKFMPNSNDLTIVSCGRDGQVRMGCLSLTGTCQDTKKIAQHRGSAHKLALDRAGSNSVFFSCGEDAIVIGYDLRENNPSAKLITVKENTREVPLYSIDTNPQQPFQFVVAGRDEWARVYDRRMLNLENTQVFAKYSPGNLPFDANITCVVYNHDGQELLCSYNDEDIYLFDTTQSCSKEFQRKFKGHRNSATVKGVNFYGPNSEFVVSGSDCGNIFLWLKASSQVVRFMPGDEGGVVNVLEPHPNLPILATSGLDSDIKVWAPTGDGEVDETKLKALMLANRKDRLDEWNNVPRIDSNHLWRLLRTWGRSGVYDDSDDSFVASDSEDGGRQNGSDCVQS